jgi:hypothetical protein
MRKDEVKIGMHCLTKVGGGRVCVIVLSERTSVRTR